MLNIPLKEILDQYENIKLKFDKLTSHELTKNGKLVKINYFNDSSQNIKTLTSKDYELAQNQLMNYFNDVVMKQENIPMILKTNLDLKIWNLLTERTSKILKHKIEPSHLGKNAHVIIQNLYSTILDDLRNNFQFFRNIYSIITNYAEKDINILISNILNFMGDIKKLKLIVNKKFNEFKEFINVEGDSKKDANDCLRFFNYALNNNPYNTRIYSNLGFAYREFMKDHQNSAYWFIRALACVDNELKKVKDNLEKDFNSIRKQFLNQDYIVEAKNIQFLKYDLDYLPILYYRIIGILYMNIDIDKLGDLILNFKTIIDKVLTNYAILPDHYRFTYEINGLIEQMVILGIFNFHYNLNNLSDYSNDPEKIILKTEVNQLLTMNVYNHNILKLQSSEQNGNGKELKNSFKVCLNFLNIFIRTVCLNMNEDNIAFVEKFLLIIFYWLSLNYDVFNLIMDDELKRNLKYFNFVIRNDLELKRLMANPYIFQEVITKINTMILPMETTFFGFIPLNRYFVLNPKSGILKVDDIKDLNLINKICLIHFLDTFGLTAENIEEVSAKFWRRNAINIKETVITAADNLGNQQSNALLKDKLLTFNKLPINLNVKKVKTLILLDACNIAMRHGDRTFSTKGIQIVMDYFTKNGHQVLSFLPEYLFRSKEGNQNFANKKRVVPDDITYLKKLSTEGLVVQTPPQDYDDSYCIQYAKQYNAYIVTNDLYRDYIENISDQRKRETEKMWVKEKCISFTFNKDEFIPNPDSSFFKEFSINEYSAKSKNLESSQKDV
jgi:hypothetical protein